MTDFASLIKGDIITPADPEYAAAIARWAKNAERKAKLVVFVKDAEDVAASIAYAKENRLPFAIRGGGHNAAGASSVENGLVVDLSRYLNSVKVDVESKLGYIGGGALWADVDAEAIKYGLATVGGTVNHTGVGGLTVGGGYGWLSGRHGLTVDNLRQATVVTADGSVLKANETENPELFWGIRGGGSNFGVVTEFVLQLHPQRETVFSGHAIYTADKVEKILEVTKEWWPTVGSDEGMMQTFSVHEGKQTIVILFFYNGSEAEGRKRFKPFLDIEHFVDEVKQIPYEKMNSLLNDWAHTRSYYLSGTVHNVPSLASAIAVLNKCDEVAKAGKFEATLIHEYLSLSKIRQIPPSSTAFRRQLSPNVLVVLAWEDAVEQTQEAQETARGIVELIKQGQVENEDEKFGYTNYDMDASATSKGITVPNWEDKAKEGFGANYARLQKVKKQYDPEVFFNRWFPIAPA